MTNYETIIRAAQPYIKSGIIRTTGREITFRDAIMGSFQCLEPEPLHTYATWKKLGYQVKRGEHAKVKIKIWKFIGDKKGESQEKEENEEENSPEKVYDSDYFMKLSFFFTSDQVEEIKK